MDDRTDEADDDIAALGSKSPGEDPADPYEEVDVSELPDWWQRAIRVFREYGLRPYRPPRFEDGELKHEVVDELEDRYDVTIDFVGIDSKYQDDWQIRIDGALIKPIGHRRSPNGYTVFELESDAFRNAVRNHFEDRG